MSTCVKGLMLAACVTSICDAWPCCQSNNNAFQVPLTDGQADGGMEPQADGGAHMAEPREVENAVDMASHQAPLMSKPSVDMQVSNRARCLLLLLIFFFAFSFASGLDSLVPSCYLACGHICVLFVAHLLAAALPFVT